MNVFNTQQRKVAEGCIRTLKNKIYKHIVAISKNVYINKLDEIIDKYNKTYHRTTKMKPADAQSGMYIECGVKHNDKEVFVIK